MEIGSLARTDVGAPKVPSNASSQPGQRNVAAEMGMSTVVRETETGGQHQESQMAEEQSAQQVQVNKEDLQNMSVAMNKFVQILNADLHFQVHEETKELIIKFVNEKTGEVIKEYPSKEFLDMIARIREYVGMVVDKKI